jgi:hypothetical protein
MANNCIYTVWSEYVKKLQWILDGENVRLYLKEIGIAYEKRTDAPDVKIFRSKDKDKVVSLVDKAAVR